MSPVNFRPPGHVELVQDQSSVNSFEDEIKKGELGTVVDATSIHGHSWPFPLAHQRLWKNVVKRAALDAEGEELKDVDYDDEGEWEKMAVEDVIRLRNDARQWLRGSGDDPEDFHTVVAWMGLTREQGEKMSEMSPRELLANIRAEEDREAEIERRRKK